MVNQVSSAVLIGFKWPIFAYSALKLAFLGPHIGFPEPKNTTLSLLECLKRASGQISYGFVHKNG